MSVRTSRPVLLVAASVLLAGCIDPEGQFNDFAEKRDRMKPEGGALEASPCTPPGVNPAEDGPVLLSVSTDLGPTKPIMFKGQASIVEMSPGQNGLRFEVTALDATDRSTPVGEVMVQGPFPIASTGEVVATIARGITPGAANPILPGVDVESEVMLTGQICDPLPAKWATGPVTEFSCGTVSGQLYQPLQQAITGNFTIIRLADINVIPAQPPYDCAGSPADPLP